MLPFLCDPRSIQAIKKNQSVSFSTDNDPLPIIKFLWELKLLLQEKQQYPDVYQLKLLKHCSLAQFLNLYYLDLI